MNEWTDEWTTPKLYLTLSEDDKTWIMHLQAIHFNKLFVRLLLYLYRGFIDTGYLLFYFQGYMILLILLLGIWGYCIQIFITFTDFEYLGKLITRITASL